MAGEVKKCEFVDKKRREKYSCLSSTPVENMREQPEALKLVYSPRRPGKAVENADENSKTQKSMKLINNSNSSSSDGSQKRKSLQTLQPSASGQKHLVGGKVARKTKNDKKHSKQPKRASGSKSKQLIHLPKCSKDIDSTSSSSEVETTSTRSENPSDIQTSSDEAYSLMVQDQAPEKYWELVAEERRKALEETLEENLKLYQMIEELKEENKVLQEKASHRDYFATMYKIAQDDKKPVESKEDV